MNKRILKHARPQRTRAHIIADQSRLHVEKFVVDAGYTADRPFSDYGTDLLINTYNEDGFVENGEIKIQLKASDRLKYSADRRFVTIAIGQQHLNVWRQETMPVFLVVYDARESIAYWLYVQEYLAVHLKTSKGKSITLKLSVANTFDERTPQLMRQAKQLVLDKLRKGLLHDC